MPKSSSLLLITIFFYFSLLLLQTCNGVSASSLDSLKSNETDAMLKRACPKNVGQCIGTAELAGEEDEEMGMESESSRRVLAMQKKYISYDTLKKDVVPCERPGASYYNCRAAGVANPYTRGCEVITMCARNIRDIKS